jgi:deoxyribodipyrimidine photo-lyase
MSLNKPVVTGFEKKWKAAGERVMINKERIHYLNSIKTGKGDYVLYWMQASQRAHCNHALEYAVRRANELGLPLLVCFGITDSYPQAQERHYLFMCEGLREVRKILESRGIGFVAVMESPDTAAIDFSRNAAFLVTDRGYTRHQRLWRHNAALAVQCPLVEVESDAVVPVSTASPKREFSAATFRPRIRAKLPYFLVPLQESEPRIPFSGGYDGSLDLDRITALLEKMPIQREAGPVHSLRGGNTNAKVLLGKFLETSLSRYRDDKNDPSLEGLSLMSPYLHFGQISPLSIALAVREYPSPGADAYLEELIVRRELAINYTYYETSYDSYDSLPSWALRSLEEHGRDRREYLYDRETLERGCTHDPYWNAAQKEMMMTGKMHGYMRMYWGKKILEWSPGPREAFTAALYLNDKYEIDGRDPNGYAGVAWCFGLHDRPWGERAVFGKIRYMNARGLERKFTIGEYVKKIDSLMESPLPGDWQNPLLPVAPG